MIGPIVAGGLSGKFEISCLPPSSTMLDRIESLLTEDDIAEYAATLVDRIDGDIGESTTRE